MKEKPWLFLKSVFAVTKKSHLVLFGLLLAVCLTLGWFYPTQTWLSSVLLMVVIIMRYVMCDAKKSAEFGFLTKHRPRELRRLSEEELEERGRVERARALTLFALLVFLVTVIFAVIVERVRYGA